MCMNFRGYINRKSIQNIYAFMINYALQIQGRFSLGVVNYDLLCHDYEGENGVSLNY